MTQTTLATATRPYGQPASVIGAPVDDWFEAALRTSVGGLEPSPLGSRSSIVRNSWGDDDEDGDEDLPEDDLPVDEEEDEPDPFEDFDEEDFDDDFDDDFEEELEDEYEIEPADDGMLEGHPDAEDIDDVDGDTPAIEFTDDE
jgi:hypothetical protein